MAARVSLGTIKYRLMLAKSQEKFCLHSIAARCLYGRPRPGRTRGTLFADKLISVYGLRSYTATRKTRMPRPPQGAGAQHLMTRGMNASPALAFAVCAQAHTARLH